MNKDRIILAVGLIAALFIATAIFGMKPKHTSAPVSGTDTKKQDNEREIADWKTYVNSQYGFSIDHPFDIAAGADSKNSVLGTFEKPVKGIHVGGLVFIPLTSELLKKTAGDYINVYINEAQKSAVPPSEEPGIECKYQQLEAQVLTDYVYCIGEGGPATYALIKGNNLSVFVDGYSRGFGSNVSPGRMDQALLKQIIASFRFNQ